MTPGPTDIAVPEPWGRRFLSRAANRCVRASAFVTQAIRLAAVAAFFPGHRRFLELKNAAYPAGMFSHVASVLGLLAHYESWKSSYAGLKIDFADQGLYYDPIAGPNWWEYYFEPIQIGPTDHRCSNIIGPDEQSAFAGVTEVGMSRTRGYELISRYVKAKPHIRDKVELFVRENFAGSYVIGIHYRGTDKDHEAPRIPYETVEMKVRKEMEAVETGRCRLFVATDEQAFLDYLLALFPGTVTYCDVARSTDGRPIYLGDENNYKKGEEAVLDCLVLARCDCIIRTVSNLGLISTMFNPGMPEVLIDMP